MSGTNFRKRITGQGWANLLLVLFGIGGFALALTLLRLTGVTGKPLDLALYIFAVSFLPLICALVASRSLGVFPVAPEPVVSSERGSFFFLLAVLLALPLLFFDFSLAVEPLHYLTVMAPLCTCSMVALCLSIRSLSTGLVSCWQRFPGLS